MITDAKGGGGSASAYCRGVFWGHPKRVCLRKHESIDSKHDFFFLSRNIWKCLINDNAYHSVVTGQSHIAMAA